MQFTQVLVTSIVAAVAVVAITLLFVGGGWGPSYVGLEAGPYATPANWSTGGHGGLRPGLGGRHGFRAFCDERSGDRIEDLLVLGKRRLGLAPEQKPAWDDLGTAVRAAAGNLTALCGQMTDAPSRSADARLAQAETMMAAGLDAVRRVQPAFHALYTALDESQRKVLDDLAAHRRRH